jgi:hypothetical protein
MTAAARKPVENLMPAVDIFRVRCEARAILVEACLFDLQDAVDGLQEAAVSSGLVDDIGQDAVQRMMADAFARPQFTYQLLIGPIELAAWLAKHTAAECAAILHHIETTITRSARPAGECSTRPHGRN